ncbi:MAG TPA: SRPBCC family protein [Acidimicrobiales bacterium]|nr:SRPBCC family protein [Acidimicrobiales bacterium]
MPPTSPRLATSAAPQDGSFCHRPCQLRCGHDPIAAPVTAGRASVRREVRIARPADEVWPLIGEPTRLPEWFPGIASATVDGTTRTVVTGAGLPMPEQIVTNDPLQRRFQYRLTGPMVRSHLSTIDVFDLGDGTCLVAYGADAEPATMALVIAGAAGAALEHLRDLMEADQTGGAR